MFMVTHDSPVSSKQTSNKNACNKKLSTGEIFMKMTMVCFSINQLVTEDHGNVQQIFHCENQPGWVLITNNQLVAEIENICDDKDCVDFKNDSFFVCSESIVEDHASNYLHKPNQECYETYGVSSDILPCCWKYICLHTFLACSLSCERGCHLSL